MSRDLHRRHPQLLSLHSMLSAEASIRFSHVEYQAGSFSLCLHCIKSLYAERGDAGRCQEVI